MALRKTGRLADSIATPTGIKSKDGAMLVSNDGSFYIHSKEFMDEWNGVKVKVKDTVKRDPYTAPAKKKAVTPKAEIRGTRKATPEKSKAKKWFGRK